MPSVFGPSTTTARQGNLRKRRSAMWRSPWNVPAALGHEQKEQKWLKNMPNPCKNMQKTCENDAKSASIKPSEPVFEVSSNWCSPLGAPCFESAPEVWNGRGSQVLDQLVEQLWAKSRWHSIWVPRWASFGTEIARKRMETHAKRMQNACETPRFEVHYRDPEPSLLRAMHSKRPDAWKQVRVSLLQERNC